MDKISPEETVTILANALIEHLIRFAQQSHKDCDAIGQVIRGYMDDVRADYVFKYDFLTEGWALYSVPPDKYAPYTILYYHGTAEDAVTQAALHGDDVVLDEDIGL